MFARKSSGLVAKTRDLRNRRYFLSTILAAVETPMSLQRESDLTIF